MPDHRVNVYFMEDKRIEYYSEDISNVNTQFHQIGRENFDYVVYFFWCKGILYVLHKSWF